MLDKLLLLHIESKSNDDYGDGDGCNINCSSARDNQQIKKLCASNRLEMLLISLASQFKRVWCMHEKAAAIE